MIKKGEISYGVLDKIKIAPKINWLLAPGSWLLAPGNGRSLLWFLGLVRLIRIVSPFRFKVSSL
jgi:hypothetical protein